MRWKFRWKFIFISYIFLIILAVNFASKLGEPCSLSFECDEGYCDAGICKLPQLTEYSEVGDCNTTANCLEGFCYDKKCILPIRKEFEIISTELTKDSCTALITNCTGAWCLLCNGNWILLIVVSVLSAFIASKYERRILPILLFIIPFLVGVIFAPFIGLIMGVLIFVILHLAIPAKTILIKYIK